MGGPSAAIVIEELLDLGARTLVRIGTCGALADGFELGELVSAREVLVADGAGAAPGPARGCCPSRRWPPYPRARGARPVGVVSTDLFHDPREDVERGWRAAGAEVVEMEASTLLALAARRGAAAAVLLAVSDLLATAIGGGSKVRSWQRPACGWGETALAALGATGQR